MAMWLYLILLSLSINPIFCNEIEAKRLVDSLTSPSRYDKDVRPLTDEPTMVKINMFIRYMKDLDDSDDTIDLQVTFRQQWNDSRLRHDKSIIHDTPYLTIRNPSLVWTPDLFFTNEKEGKFHELMQPNVLIRVDPDGQVLYSRRISLKLICYMSFYYFPFDRQICSMKLASYGETTKSLIFLWKEYDPVTVTRTLNLRNFVLSGFKTDNCTSRTSTGEYSCLVADFIFDRKFYSYWKNIYFPSILIHILAWIPFWLGIRWSDEKMSNKKISNEENSNSESSNHKKSKDWKKKDKSGKKRFLLSLTALVLIFWFSLNVSPPGSPNFYSCSYQNMWINYIRLINFVAFLHVCYIEKGGREKCCKKGKKHYESNNDAENIPLKDEESGGKKINSDGKNKLSSFAQKLKKIDCLIFGRIFYPSIFIIFNIFYWCSALKKFVYDY